MYNLLNENNSFVEKIYDLFKGATKLCFWHYLHVVIILFSTGLYKSALSTYCSGKTVLFLYFCNISFLFLNFLFDALDSMSCHLKRLNNICIIRGTINHVIFIFFLILFKQSVEI